MRLYVCWGCGAQTETDGDLPHEWLALRRFDVEADQPLRLGVYCTVTCLWNLMPAMERAERLDFAHERVFTLLPRLARQVVHERMRRAV